MMSQFPLDLMRDKMLHTITGVSDGVRRDAAHGTHPHTCVNFTRVLVAAATGDGHMQRISLPELNKTLL